MDWEHSAAPLTKLTVFPEGIIEDAEGALHADFANKFIGGGTLEHGCVQEEIMFTVQPELIASMFFCSVMQRKEAILMIGSEQVRGKSSHEFASSLHLIYLFVFEVFGIQRIRFQI